MKVSVKLLPHTSVAVAVAKFGVAGQDIVEVAGNSEITGAVVSITFIVCDAVETLLQESVAIQVLVNI